MTDTIKFKKRTDFKRPPEFNFLSNIYRCHFSLSKIVTKFQLIPCVIKLIYKDIGNLFFFMSDLHDSLMSWIDVIKKLSCTVL